MYADCKGQLLSHSFTHTVKTHAYTLTLARRQYANESAATYL